MENINQIFPRNIKDISRQTLLVVLLGMFYRLLWIFQGVDTVDIGFCNVFYDAIFERPETNTFNFVYYLTGLVGGAWERYLGFGGLVGFRCLEVFTLTLAICFTYKSCRDFIDERYRWMALAISFLFPLIVVTFHYDTFSYFLLAISSFYYSKFLKNKRLSYIVLAGVFIGLSFFARIVNLSMLALVIVVFASTFLRGTFRESLRPTIAICLGIVVGVLIVFMLMLSFGHLQYFEMALSEAFGTLSNSSATHSRGEMLIRYGHSLVNLLLQIAVVGILYGFYIYSRRFNDNQKKIINVILCALALILAYTSLPYLFLLASCILILSKYFTGGVKAMLLIC